MTPLSAPSLIDDESDQSTSSVTLSPSFLLFMGSSGVLASVAMLSDSVPVLIGAMIVAPMMPPLALVPFALVARRHREAARGLGIALAGLTLAFVTAWVTTAVMDSLGVIGSDVVLLDKPLLEERLHPGWWSMAAAIAAGVTGIVAQAQEKTDTIIGTVASLALVPAVGATSIALYVGELAPALGGLLLLGMNVGLIIGMGAAVVLVSRGRAGLRPLALVPCAIVLVVGLLLVWAQSTDTVPRTPSNAGLTSSAGGLDDHGVKAHRPAPAQRPVSTRAATRA